MCILLENGIITKCFPSKLSILSETLMNNKFHKVINKKDSSPIRIEMGSCVDEAANYFYLEDTRRDGGYWFLIHVIYVSGQPVV